MNERILTTVERMIEEIVTKNFVPFGVNYLFMNWAQTNLEIDKLQGPTIAYILPAAGTLNFNAKRARVYDIPQTQIAFIAPTEFDFESDENDGIIEEMRRLAIAFITAINASGNFEPIENNLDYQVIYDYLDENVTGILIAPVLKEKVGLMNCPEALRTDNTFKDIFGYELT